MHLIRKLYTEYSQLYSIVLKNLFSLKKVFSFALVCFIVFGIIGFAATGFCTESDQDEIPLTLTRAVEIALANSPKPEQALQAILAAENRYKKSKAGLYPTLGLTGSISAGKLNYTKYDTASLEYMKEKRGSQISLGARYTRPTGSMKSH